jgi:hypothetical protein
MKVLEKCPVPDLSEEDRVSHPTRLRQACEAADTEWLWHMLDRGAQGGHEWVFYAVFLLPSRWDRRVNC